jgi:hypothetical protein
MEPKKCVCYNQEMIFKTIIKLFIQFFGGFVSLTRYIHFKLKLLFTSLIAATIIFIT